MAATEILEREVVFHRYYDPATGQFMSVDPLVDVTAQPYVYVGDDPVNASDPSGLAKQLTFAGLAKMARSIPTQCGSARDAALNAYWAAYGQYWANRRDQQQSGVNWFKVFEGVEFGLESFATIGIAATTDVVSTAIAPVSPGLAALGYSASVPIWGGAATLGYASYQSFQEAFQ
jgi:hypothetical protein